MPEIEKGDNPQEGAEIAPATKSEELPKINLPQTKTPVSFNQQVNNFQQIPPSAWDGLTPGQRLELTRSILAQMDSMDKRHYDFAVTHVRAEATRSNVGSICGALIAVLGFSLSGYLSLHGETIVALSISMPLATILAIVVGNRFVSHT
jgi:hypothetical protein